MSLDPLILSEVRALREELRELRAEVRSLDERLAPQSIAADFGEANRDE